jgi:hypothetical protein
VLSVSQPWAQLIVRGMKLREVRSWGTDYRGRIAIHAASKAPSFDAVAKASHDVAVAAWFADQRWHTRDDVLALPRSAIVGTVELTHVRPAPPDADSDEPFDWIFTFADAVEFEPLGGISGKQRLWTLDDIASKEVEGRERARRATADDGGRAPRSLLPRDRGDAVVARFGRTLERRQQAESDHLKPMPNEALERRFRAKFDAYCAAHGMGGLTPTLERIRVAGPMARWFQSRTLPRITLERLLREELWRVAWQNEGRHSPREGILDWSFYNDRAPDDFDERIEPPTPRRRLTPSAEDNREARYRRMMATLDAVTAVASPPTSRARPPRISD